MSGVRVMAAFAAGAALAGMVVGVARVTEVVEPSTAVAEPALAAKPSAAEATLPAAPAASEPRPETPVKSPGESPPARWRAPQAGPEEVTAGVLAKVASRSAPERCELAREPAAPDRRGGKGAPRGPKAERCRPEEGIESVEIEWNAPSATR